jgi:Flp pilus assembly protein TadD
MTRRIVVVCVAAALLAIGGVWIYRLVTAGSVPAASSPSTPVSQPVGPIDEVVRKASGGLPVIFVGLDAVDWDWLDPLMASGAMPNLSSLVKESATGRFETIHPPLSPLVWTTMVTGVDPTRHGILDFLHLRPDTGEKEPITSTERRVPAVWNMAGWAGKRVAVFGLWATYPAEAVNGLMVSDRMFTFLYSEETPPPGVVFPPDREAWARDVAKRAERAIDYETVHAYLPWLTNAEYETATADINPYSNPVSALHRILVQTRIYHDLASEWIRAERPDLAFVYFEGTDSIGHVFAPFVPPRQPEVSTEDYAHYKGVGRQYFQLIDRMIGEYKAMAQANKAALVLASDHGFTWGKGRPTDLSSVANATAAKWHRQYGMYLIWAPGVVSASVTRGDAGIIQLCPTLLALLGLPHATGTTDTPVPGVSFTSAAAVDYSRFFVPAELPPSAPRSARDDKERLDQLRALGYIGAAEPLRVAPRTGPDRTRTAGSYNNEGLVLKNQNRINEAIAAFDKAIEIEPKLASALWNLSDLLFADRRDLDRSDELLLRALDAGLPEATKYIVGRAIGYQRDGQVARSLKLLQPATRIRPDIPDFWLFTGRYLVDTGDCEKAVEDFDHAVQLQPQNAAAYSARAIGRVCTGDRAGAREDLRRALALDPNQPKVRELLRDLDR